MDFIDNDINGTDEEVFNLDTFDMLTDLPNWDDFNVSSADMPNHSMQVSVWKKFLKIHVPSTSLGFILPSTLLSFRVLSPLRTLLQRNRRPRPVPQRLRPSPA